jgi:S4 domain
MENKRAWRSLVNLSIFLTMMSIRTTGFLCIGSGQTLLKSIDLLFMSETGIRSALTGQRSFSSSGRKICLTMKYDETKPSKTTGAGKSRNGPSRKASGVSSSLSNNDGKDKNQESSGVRLNKCLHELSRRGADDAISEGRVTINNKIATNGMRVQRRDVVRLVSLSTLFSAQMMFLLNLPNNFSDVDLVHFRPS